MPMLNVRMERLIINKTLRCTFSHLKIVNSDSYFHRQTCRDINDLRMPAVHVGADHCTRLDQQGDCLSAVDLVENDGGDA